MASVVERLTASRSVGPRRPSLSASRPASAKARVSESIWGTPANAAAAPALSAGRGGGKRTPPPPFFQGPLSGPGENQARPRQIPPVAAPPLRAAPPGECLAPEGAGART